VQQLYTRNENLNFVLAATYHIYSKTVFQPP